MACRRRGVRHLRPLLVFNSCSILLSIAPLASVAASSAASPGFPGGAARGGSGDDLADDLGFAHK